MHVLCDAVAEHTMNGPLFAKGVAMMLRCFVLGIAALSMSARDVRAAEFRVPTLGHALRTGNLTIPAAWAGVWATSDSTHECSDPTILDRSAGFDTLCTGAPVDENMTCTGSVDDNNVNIMCTNSIEFFPGCTAQFDVSFVGTRNGNTFSTVTTVNTTFAPPNCAMVPNSCEVTETGATRVGPEPQECAMSVQPSAWGQVKTRYR